mmetsp:Transcript_18347/g.21937  ORF Transcript_18347/g.21937 Transcript_18347/m.21937 type:complete len:119 (+) Transcript_18347:876-1232(+)
MACPESTRRSDGHGLLPKDSACDNLSVVKVYIIDLIDIVDTMLETDKDITSVEAGYTVWWGGCMSLNRCLAQYDMGGFEADDNLSTGISNDEKSSMSQINDGNNGSKYKNMLFVWRKK